MQSQSNVQTATWANFRELVLEGEHPGDRRFLGAMVCLVQEARTHLS